MNPLKSGGMAPDFPCQQSKDDLPVTSNIWLGQTALHATIHFFPDAVEQAHLSHEEGAAVIEDLSVVGTLGQRVQPHADCLLSISIPDVKVGQSVS